jgi:hypothetical protein
MTHGFSFLIIVFNFSTAESFACKNILSNNKGLPSSSNTTILQPALNHGSIANIFLPYSGLVISKLPKFCLKDSIASSSQISFNIHLNSFSTESKSVEYHSLNQTSKVSINGSLISKSLA